MREHARLIAVCCTILLLAVIGAVQFRYKTYNKEGWRTAVYDRWTGSLKLCDQGGCYTEEDLQRIALINRPKPSLPDHYIRTALGVDLIFPGEAAKKDIEETVARLDACGEKAATQRQFADCYRPTVSEQADGTYRLNGVPELSKK